MGQEANDSNVSTAAENTDIQTDNSEFIDNHEPLGDNDNSDEDVNNNEPANNDGGDAANGENQQQQQDGQFNDLAKANEAYAKLRELNGKQSNELGELRKQAEEAAKLKEQIANMQLAEAQKKGFQDVQSYQNHKEVANFVANEYAKHIQECEFPEEMVNLLDEYRKNPSDDVLETIESQFSVEVLKDVAGKNAIFKGQLQAKEQEALENEVKQSAKSYLDENVNKYADEFQNPAFAALYGEAFRAYGCDLDTDKFVNLMREYAKTIIATNGIVNDINKENQAATDEIAGLTMGNNATKSSNGKSLLQMSEQDLNKRLDELI